MIVLRFITILIGIIFVVQIVEILEAPKLQGFEDGQELETPEPKPFPREQFNKALDELREILAKSENKIVLESLKFHITAEDFETIENIHRKINQMLDIAVQKQYLVAELKEALKDIITRLSSSENRLIKNFVVLLRKITTEHIERAIEAAEVLRGENSVLYKHFDGVLKELKDRLNDSKNPVVQEIVEIIGKTKIAELDNENKLIQILGRSVSKKNLSVDEIETAIREVHDRLKGSKNFMIQGFAIILNITTTRDIELMIQLKKIFNSITGNEKEGSIEKPQSAEDIEAALKQARDIIKDFNSYGLRSIADDIILALEKNLSGHPLKENSEKFIKKSRKRGIKLKPKRLVVLRKKPKSKKEKKE